MKWIGFSTHAPTPVIVKAIESNQFDYVNLHYHFIGSYTASGTGISTSGNLEVGRYSYRMQSCRQVVWPNHPSRPLMLALMSTPKGDEAGACDSG